MAPQRRALATHSLTFVHRRLLKVYPTDEAALTAVTRNSAIVLPYLNRPTFIAGTCTVLLDKMSEAEALDVITRNPGENVRVGVRR